MTKEQREIVDKEIILLDKKDIKKITGWSEGVIDRLFAKDPDFPAIKIGKSCQVEYQAFKKYLSKRRSNNKNNYNYI